MKKFTHIIFCSCGYSSTEACMGFNNICLKCNQTINTGNGPILNAVLQSDNIDLLIKKDDEEEEEIYE